MTDTNTNAPQTSSSAARVMAAATDLGLEIKVVTHGTSTRTAQEAADACGVDVAQIVKSMIFADGADTLTLILVSGRHNADLGAIEAREGLTLARANARRIRDETGFAIGGVAPIGHLKAMPVYMDETLLTLPEVWCAAGRPDNMFAVAPAALAKATGATIIKVTE